MVKWGEGDLQDLTKIKCHLVHNTYIRGSKSNFNKQVL